MKKKLRSHCPINYGLEAFGDRWSLLILRDMIFRGKRTYGEFLKSEEKIATNILASRLAQLESDRILERRRDPDDARRDLFVLTEKGVGLVPILFEMMLWSAQHDKKSEARRVTRLLERIRSNNRAISERVMEKVRAGEALFPEYLD